MSSVLGNRSTEVLSARESHNSRDSISLKGVNASTINRSIGFDNPVRGYESNPFEHPTYQRTICIENPRYKAIIPTSGANKNAYDMHYRQGFGVMSSMRTPSGIPLCCDFGGVTIMDPNSSLRKICLGDDVVVISSDKFEGSGDWNSLEYQERAGSKGKKVINELSFYRMETDEISEWYIAPCFVNGLEAYDGEINLGFDENLLSNEFTIKLCLDYEMKKEKKLVKKELIVALRGELYFVKLIINPEEDDFEPGVILGRSFLRLAKGVVDFDLEDKVELDGKTIKEDEEAVKRIKGEALKEKDDPGAFIFPIRLEGKVNENALADTGSDINIMPYRIYETLGRE
ncbi:hypothetical protein Tco_0502253 [Tanacetum coccineum]